MLSGCSSGNEENTANSTKDKEKDGTYDIVVMPKLVGVPFYTSCEEGTKKAAEELGVNVIFNGPTVADAAEQVKMLEDYITQGVDAICVAPNDAAALDNVLKKQKMPVLLFWIGTRKQIKN